MILDNIINAFPGYEWVYDENAKEYKNMYRGTDVGRGGYIYSEPGIYGNVALLDVASMHPNSVINMNAFGDYTQNFKDLLDARIAIKHGDYDSARHMLNGRLAKYLDDESIAKDLAQATKIAINSVYGLTSAGFDNPFRDKRNKNNFIALRGALTMRTLQDAVKEQGYTVVSIRTDSIKIADATPEIIEFVNEFGRRYGYSFEHEATYDKMCLVNDSAYIAKYAGAKRCEEMYGYIPGDNKKHGNEWTATAAQFQVPYVFKTLFSKEPIEFEDICETKEVKNSAALYLDMNENLPDVTEHEKAFDKLEDKFKKGQLSDVLFESECQELQKKIDEGHSFKFVGKVGLFCPIKPGRGGGWLVVNRNGKYSSATGAKDYRWLESAMVKELGKEDDIDISYYRNLVDKAVEAISKYGDFEWFVSDDPYNGYVPTTLPPDFMNIPEDADEEEGLPWED